MIRIVSWNCNQGLSRKTDRLLELNPDIAVISEAGRETELGDGQLRRAAWAGRSETKGLAVFVRDGVEADVDASWDDEREWFLPIRTDLDDGLGVLAVWASYGGSEPRSKWVRTLSALQHYRDFLASHRVVVIGDFNNNALWDTTTKPVFGSITDELDSSGYESVYHARTGETHGEESAASFYHQRNPKKPYLIDHAFIPRDWVGLVADFKIGHADDWLEYSDHMPLTLDLAV